MPEESVGKNQTVTAKTNFYCSCTTAVWPSFEDQIKVKLASSIKGYIVYLNKTGGLEWHVTNELDEKLPDTFNAFHNRVGLLRAACPAELRAEDRDSYLTLLGFGMTCALEGSEKDASAILDSAVEFLADRNQRTARQWHLATSICVTTVVVAGTLLIFPPSSFRSLMSAAAAGAAGALLSILQRLGSTQVDFAAGRAVHVLEASGRIIAGMIGGVIVGEAVRAGLILGRVADNQAAITLACMLGGVSERLVPSLLSKIDGAVPPTTGNKTDWIIDPTRP